MLFVDLRNTGIYILFSVLNIYLVILSRQSLFWERRIVVLLMGAVGLSLLEGYCVRHSYIRWYVVIRVVLSLRQLQLDVIVFSVRYRLSLYRFNS